MTAAAPLDPKYVSLLWAGPDQAGAIAGLHEQLFVPPWNEAGIRALLDHPASTAFVAMIGNPKTAVGFIMGQIAADEAEILSIGVAEPWQRKGLGKRLVDGLARAVKKAEGRSIFLEVAADNAAALALYKRLGFTETGRRKGYYERPGAKAVDALRLSLAI
jgi:ribosomal-protein-alanine N-acetyltransferase